MPTNANKIIGGCLCGAIRFEADQAPFDTGYCHCRMCQKGLGALFGAWVFFNNADFRYTTREPQWHWSSKTVRRGFCPDCGSPITYRPDDVDFDDVDFTTIWIGTLDEPHRFKPKAHWHTESKIPWVDIHPNLPDNGAEFEVQT
jgi:hypothetical protein